MLLAASVRTAAFPLSKVARCECLGVGQLNLSPKMCLFCGPFYFLSFVIFGSNRFLKFFFPHHLFLCCHVFVLALMGCWCYHMIFHLASSVWLAWLQSLRNSCSLLTTRFFILFFSAQFSILPFSFGVLFFVLFYIFIYFWNKKMMTQWANGRN